MCWRQLWDVGESFGRFRHQHPISFNIFVGHQHPKYVTNIETLSTTYTCHHHLCSHYSLFQTRNQINQSIYFNFFLHNFWWNAKLFFAKIFVDDIKRYTISILITQKSWLDGLVGSIFQLPYLYEHRTKLRFLSYLFSFVCWKLTWTIRRWSLFDLQQWLSHVQWTL